LELARGGERVEALSEAMRRLVSVSGERGPPRPADPTTNEGGAAVHSLMSSDADSVRPTGSPTVAFFQRRRTTSGDSWRRTMPRLTRVLNAALLAATLVLPAYAETSD